MCLKIAFVCLLNASLSVFYIHAHSSFKQLRLSHNLDEERRDLSPLIQNIHLKFQKKHNDGIGFEPGDSAAPFQIKTLDGVLKYPAPKNSSVIIHAFTNKSAFLECMWSSNDSLTDLVEYLPENTQVLFLSLDDSASKDALWMQEQVYKIAAGSQRYGLPDINRHRILYGGRFWKVIK